MSWKTRSNNGQSGKFIHKNKHLVKSRSVVYAGIQLVDARPDTFQAYIEFHTIVKNESGYNVLMMDITPTVARSIPVEEYVRRSKLGLTDTQQHDDSDYVEALNAITSSIPLMTGKMGWKPVELNQTQLMFHMEQSVITENYTPGVGQFTGACRMDY
jgi:hypothetical protein